MSEALMTLPEVAAWLERPAVEVAIALRIHSLWTGEEAVAEGVVRTLAEIEHIHLRPRGGGPASGIDGEASQDGLPLPRESGGQGFLTQATRSKVLRQVTHNLATRHWATNYATPGQASRDVRLTESAIGDAALNALTRCGWATRVDGRRGRQFALLSEHREEINRWLSNPGRSLPVCLQRWVQTGE